MARIGSNRFFMLFWVVRFEKDWRTEFTTFCWNTFGREGDFGGDTNGSFFYNFRRAGTPATRVPGY